MTEYMVDRCEYLSDLSNLNVVVRRERKGCNVFIFLCGDKEVAAYWSYKKAKAFAKGVQWGVDRGIRIGCGDE